MCHNHINTIAAVDGVVRHILNLFTVKSADSQWAKSTDTCHKAYDSYPWIIWYDMTRLFSQYAWGEPGSLILEIPVLYTYIVRLFENTMIEAYLHRLEPCLVQGQWNNSLICQRHNLFQCKILDKLGLCEVWICASKALHLQNTTSSLMLSVNRNVLLARLPGLENKIAFIWGSYGHNWRNPTITEVHFMRARINVTNSGWSFCFVVCETCPI